MTSQLFFRPTSDYLREPLAPIIGAVAARYEVTSLYRDHFILDWIVWNRAPLAALTYSYNNQLPALTLAANTGIAFSNIFLTRFEVFVAVAHEIQLFGVPKSVFRGKF